MTNEHKKDDATCPAAEKNGVRYRIFGGARRRIREAFCAFRGAKIPPYLSCDAARRLDERPERFLLRAWKIPPVFSVSSVFFGVGTDALGTFYDERFYSLALGRVALAPDKEYDKDGCYSGSAVEKDGKMYLFYTAVKGDIQTQALAVSSDGVHFKKQGVILSGEKLPADCSRHDFRDPYVF